MLRTIKTWVVYDPTNKEIYSHSRTKREAMTLRPRGCEVVQMKGHYVRKRAQTVKGERT